MTLATTISIILVLVGFVSAWIKRKYTFWKSKNILTPPYKIGWGHFKQPILQTLSFPETICLYYRYFKSKKVKHGGLYSYFFPIYMPIDLDIIKAILLTDFDHFAHRGFYRNEVDDSLTATIFSLDEDKWKWIRPKISAGYTSAKLKVMYDTIMKCAEEFNHFLGDADRDEVNMKEIVENYTMNIVGYCVFGLKCNCFEESDNEFIKYGRAFFERSLSENIKIQLTEIAPDLMKKLHTCVTQPSVTDFFQRVILQAIEYREKNNINIKDPLDILMNFRGRQNIQDGSNGDLEKENTLPFGEILGLAYSLFIGSFETTSNSICFTLYLLSIHKDIQEKAREEIRELMKKYNGQLNYESMADFVYLDMIMNESMRMFPPIHQLFRRCTADYKVPGTDLILRKGQKVFVPVMGIHYDEDYFSNPEKFDPERFSAENSKDRHPAAFLPFGMGPKYCLAQRFGLLQVKVLLIMILKKYDLSLSKKTSTPLGFSAGNHITLCSKNTIYLNFRKLQNEWK